MEKMNAAKPCQNLEGNNKIKFDLKESFEIKSNEKNFILTISINEKLIFFEIEEKDLFPKEDYNIYLNLEQLGKMNKYFIQFDN